MKRPPEMLDIGARVYNSANITIPDSTLTYLTFNSERYDTDAIHDKVTNSGRLTCKTAGKYIIAVALGFDNNTTGRRVVQIRLNHGDSIAISEEAPSPNGDIRFAFSTIFGFVAGDYVEVAVYQSSGGPLDIYVDPCYSLEFMMQRIG